MLAIDLDASGWKTPLDFIRALQMALGAPFWCGSNIDAINELMVWGLGPGDLPPPCIVSISRVSSTPKEVQDYIALQAKCVQAARDQKIARDGIDVNVSISINIAE